MRREITTHSGNTLNDHLAVEAIGEPGPGGACQHYHVSPPTGRLTCLKFQQGNPMDGINGISNEALAAVLIDRLQGFQLGPFACVDNERALNYFQAGLSALKARSKGRVDRGVEGTQQP